MLNPKIRRYTVSTGVVVIIIAASCFLKRDLLFWHALSDGLFFAGMPFVLITFFQAVRSMTIFRRSNYAILDPSAEKGKIDWFFFIIGAACFFASFLTAMLVPAG